MPEPSEHSESGQPIYHYKEPKERKLHPARANGLAQALDNSRASGGTDADDLKQILYGDRR